MNHEILSRIRSEHHFLIPKSCQFIFTSHISSYLLNTSCAMQHKLKAVFRSASRKRSGQVDDQDNRSSQRSSRDGRQVTSLDEQRRRKSGDLQRGSAHYTGRSRPLSSAFDSRGASGPVAYDHAPPSSSHLANDPIANDYRAYVSGLSCTDNSIHEPSMSLGGDRQLIKGESGGWHEEVDTFIALGILSTEADPFDTTRTWQIGTLIDIDHR